MSNIIQNLKFTECRILVDYDYKVVSIDYLITLNKDQMSRVKNDIYCPYCDNVKLTFVNTINPYLRTHKNNTHLENCNKSVRSQIKSIDVATDENIVKRLKKILKKTGREIKNEPIKKDLHHEKVSSKYVTRNILNIDDKDVDNYYFVYGRNLFINYIDNYENHRYIRLSLKRFGNHIFSIAVSTKLGFTDYPIDDKVPYDFSIFGKVTKFNGHFDINLENSKYLYFSSSKIKVESKW